MATSYVVDGAKLSCPMGSSSPNLKVVPPHNVKLRGSEKANIGDGKPMVNIPPFGMCKSMMNPAVAAATAAAMGALTPQPCTPVCAMWLGGKTDVLIQNLPALLSNSTIMCMLGGGMIKIDDDGQ